MVNRMSENRELNMDDYLAMLRRRIKVILIPALLAPLAGFLISYIPLFPPKYTSTATILVEGQKLPDNYVTPVITSDFAQRVQTLSQQVISPSKLRPMIIANKLTSPGEEGDLVGKIRQGMTVEPVITSMSTAASTSPTAKKKPSASNEPIPGFNITYSDSKGATAQKVCNALAQLFIDENLKSRSEVATSTTAFLSRQVEDAKAAIDAQDAKLADFKKQYIGQLPTDVDNNMRMLMSLNSQLDASTQTLSRAQQDKAYTESMLAQQIAAWKSSQSSTNPQTLEQQLTLLQGQLLQLQARYTDDHPDVIKTKADIAEVEKKLKEINTATANSSDTSEKASASEPPEIRQLRLQIHQYQNVIEQATVDQKRLQSQIGIYQSRTAMSPTIEEQYKVLTRDNDNAQAFYKDLLAKRSSAELGTSMENQQQGEQMVLQGNASMPDSPSFPNRPIFAAGGLGAGLAIGVLIAIFLEFSDKSIRTEKDAAAVMDLPLLISVPWLGEDEEDAVTNGNGRRRFWGRGDPGGSHDREHVEV
jgi:polysaccharide chain length determinant protein (PEP-CTERM system associated)